MTDCHALDDLITAFVDGELDEDERARVVAHLSICRACRHEVEAESTARHVLRAHAAVARTMGVTPSWRPQAFRLGRPALVVPRTAVVALVALLGFGVWTLWLRPNTVEAVGIIGDSHCVATHVHLPGNAESRGCVLNCVKRGAEFVFVSDGEVFRIDNQAFPDLATFANQRVNVTGTMAHDAITVSTLAEARDRAQ